MRLIQRIEYLERCCSRTRRVNTVLFTALVLVACLPRGYAESEAGRIEAREFVLQDEQGKVRASWKVTTAGPLLEVLDSKGRSRVRLSVGNDVPSLMLATENGKGALFLVAEKSPNLLLTDSAGKSRVSLGLGFGGARLILRDAAAVPRAIVGAHDQWDVSNDEHDFGRPAWWTAESAISLWGGWDAAKTSRFQFAVGKEGVQGYMGSPHGKSIAFADRRERVIAIQSGDKHVWSAPR